ncbi:hypothetical protein A9R05_43600 (plasmid) [Burkholderia sp. KK1]|uniref:hypothetical protein n=1 Tax=Burkholderia sp. M701 TaxID=326454 RepID=UPI00097990BF|nr:hypothetical protein [Burkholderia sp. M701]AQH05889.1 hypothetical protein A9R05_43600 [Burkholderia sp. KK1]
MSNPYKNLLVDGTGADGLFAGDGKSAPFVIFDADRQQNIAGPFNDRDAAEQATRAILHGEEPKLDALALDAWLTRIDEGK